MKLTDIYLSINCLTNLDQTCTVMMNWYENEGPYNYQILLYTWLMLFLHENSDMSYLLCEIWFRNIVISLVLILMLVCLSYPIKCPNMVIVLESVTNSLVTGCQALAKLKTTIPTIILYSGNQDPKVRKWL